MLKPACVFPIEVELQLDNMETIKTFVDESVEEDNPKHTKQDSSDEELLSEANNEETQNKQEQVITDDLISI